MKKRLSVVVLLLIICLTALACTSGSISLDKTELTLTEGEEFTLTATVSKTKDGVEWSTNNAAAATVSSEGKVTAIAPGEAVITAKAGKVSATCKVTVKAREEQPPQTPAAASFSELSGLIGNGEKTIILKGNITLGNNLTIPSGVVLKLDTSVTFDAGAYTLTNEGAVETASGFVLTVTTAQGGSFVNNGTVSGAGSFALSGTITGTGTVTAAVPAAVTVKNESGLRAVISQTIKNIALDGALTLTSGLTIPEGYTLKIASVTDINAGGYTLTNGGAIEITAGTECTVIMTAGTGAFVNNGSVTGAGLLILDGGEISGTGNVSVSVAQKAKNETDLRAYITQDYKIIILEASVTLTDDLTVPQDVTVKVRAVPAATRGIYISTFTFTNEGTIEAESGCNLYISTTTGSCINEGTITGGGDFMLGGSAVTGSGEITVTGKISAYNEAGLYALLSMGYKTIAIGGTIILTSDLDIDSDVTLRAETYSRTINVGDYIFTNSGTISIEGVTLTVVMTEGTGAFVNEGTITGTGILATSGGEVTGTGNNETNTFVSANSEAELITLISRDYKTIIVGATITLTNDLTVPSDVTLKVLAGRTINISTFTFTNEGTIEVSNGYILTVTMTSGAFVNEGTVTGEGGFSLSGTVTGSGEITVTGVITANSEAGLKSLLSLGFKTIILGSSITLSGDLDIPSDVTLKLTASRTIDAAAYTLTNEGTIEIASGYTLTVTGTSGAFVKNGTVAGEGSFALAGTMTGDGEITVTGNITANNEDGLKSLLANGIKTVVIGSTITLTGDLDIEAGVTLKITASRTVAIGANTLTNEGTIETVSGGMLTVTMTTGAFINNGTVTGEGDFALTGTVTGNGEITVTGTVNANNIEALDTFIRLGYKAITIYENITLASDFEIPSDVTLKITASRSIYVVTYTFTNEGTIEIASGVTLTVSTTAGTGVFVNNGTVSGEGTLLVNGGAVTGTGEITAIIEISANNEAELLSYLSLGYKNILLGGTITLTGDLEIPSGVKLRTAASRTVVIGTYTLTNEGTIEITSSALTVKKTTGSGVFINNGTITGAGSFSLSGTITGNGTVEVTGTVTATDEASLIMFISLGYKTVVIYGTVTLTDDFTIPSDVTLKVASNVTFSVSSYTLTNEGTIDISSVYLLTVAMTAGTGAFVNEGAITGGTLALSGGDVGGTGGTNTADTVMAANNETELRSLITQGYRAILIAGTVTLTSNYTIPSDVTLKILASRTISAGAYTFTNEGTITVASGYTFTVTSTTGTFINNGTVTGAGSFSLSGTISGTEEISVTGTINAGDDVAIRSLIAYGIKIITLGSNITLASDLTIPAGVTLKVSAARTITIGTYILTNEGRIEIASGYALTVTMTAGSGAFINNGTVTGAGNLILTGEITGSGTLTVTGTVTANNEAALRTLLAQGYTTITIGSTITLTSNLTIPSDVTLRVNGARTLNIGIYTLTNGGTINIASGTLAVTMTAGSGAFVNNGSISGAGLITVSGGELTGTGDNTTNIIISVNNEAELISYIALGYKVIILGGTLTLTDDLTIPSDMTLRVTASRTINIGDYTLTNEGTIEVIGSYTLTVTTGAGSFVNSGTVTAEYNLILGTTTVDGGTVTVTGNLTVSGTLDGDGGTVTVGGNLYLTGTLTYEGTLDVAGTVNANDAAAVASLIENGYKTIALNNTITLASDLEIPSDVTLTSGTRTVSIGTYTLTNLGTIDVTGGTLTVTATTGKFVNNGTVTAADFTFNGTMTGNGTVTATGNFTLTGTVTGYNGTLDVAGLVNANNDIAIGSLIEYGFKIIVVNGNITFTNNLEIPMDVTLRITGTRTIAVGAYTVTNEGTIEIPSGYTLTVTTGTGTFECNGVITGAGNFTLTGTMNGNKGTVDVTGTVTANNLVSLVSLLAYNPASITLAADITLTSNLEIPSGTTLKMPTRSISLARNTLTNNGTIEVTSGTLTLSMTTGATGGSFVNNGAVTGAGSLTFTGTVTGSGTVTLAGTVRAETTDAFISLLQQNAKIITVYTPDMTLTDNLTIPSDVTVRFTRSRSLAIGANTLTNYGTFETASGYTLTVSMTTGKFVNEGTVTGAGGFTLTGAVNGNGTVEVTGTVTANNEAAMKSFISLGYTTITLGGTITLTKNFTIIPEITLITASRTIATGEYTLTNVGTIVVTGSLTVTTGAAGKFVNYGTVTVSADFTLTGTLSGYGTFDIAGAATANDAAAIPALINQNCKIITIGGTVTLASNLTVPSGITLKATTSRSFNIGAYTLTNNGKIEVTSGTLTVTMTAGSGEFVNEGTVEGAGSMYLTGTITGGGEITLTGTVRAENFAALDSLTKHRVSVIALYYGITFEGNLTIPAGMTLSITYGRTFSLGANTLTNNGTIEITSSNVLTVSVQTGAFVNEGEITGTGGLTLTGAITGSGTAENLAGTVTPLDTAALDSLLKQNCKLITITSSGNNISLTGNMTIPQGVTVRFTSSKSFTIGANTLTNEGTIEVAGSSYTLTVMMTAGTGAFINNGTVTGTGRLALTGTITGTGTIELGAATASDEAALRTLLVQGCTAITIGGTITLTSNLNIASGVTLIVNGARTFNLGAYTLTNNGTIEVTSSNVLTVSVQTGAFVNNGTVTGAGNLTLTGTITGSGAISLTGTVRAEDYAALESLIARGVKTITVYQSITLGGNLTVPSDVTVLVTYSRTLTLGAYTLTNEGTIEITGTNILTVTMTAGTGNLLNTGTITGTGRLRLSSGTVTGNGQITAARADAGSFSALESLIQCGIKVITLYSDITLTSNYTIPSDVTLNVDYASRTITIGAYTLTNEGTIAVASINTLTVTMTAGSGAFINNGTITGEGNLSLTGTITGSGTVTVTGTVTANNDDTIRTLISQGYKTIVIGSTITLTSNLDIASGVTLIVNGSRTLTLGAYTLTNEGTIEITGTATLTVTMTAGTGNLVNTGTITGTGTLRLSSGTVTGSGQITVATVQASSFSALESLIQRGVKEITLYSDITLTSNLTIPSDVTLNASSITITIGTYTLTNEGTINVTSGTLTVTITAGTGVFINNGMLAVTGNLTLTGTITGSGTVTVTGTVTANNDDAIRTLISQGYKTIVIGSTFTLTSNLTIPSDVTLIVNASRSLNLGAYTFTNNGTIEIASSYVLTVSVQTGAFVNNGTITGTGTFRLSSGTVTGNGQITVATVQASTFSALESLIQCGIKVITLYSNITLTSNYTIPSDVTLNASSITITIGTYTLTNEGTIAVASSNTLTVTMTAGSGNLVNAGTITGEGNLSLTGTITGSGTVTVTGTVTANNDDAIRTLISQGYKTIVIGSTITLTSNLDIASGVTLIVNGQRTLTLGAYTLTNEGTIEITGTYVLTVTMTAGTGNLVNTGTITGTGTFRLSSGTITGSGQITVATVQASTFSALESLILCGVKVITVYSDITLTSNYTIPSDVTLNVDYTSRTITIGAYTLTNEGTIAVASSNTLTVTMTAGSGNLVNAGTITGEGNLSLTGTITGSGTVTVTGTVTANNDDAIRTLISQGYKTIVIGSTITLTSNLTIPADVTLKAESNRTIAIETYTLTNEGTIDITAYTLTVTMTAGTGNLVNDGTITGTGTLRLSSGTVTGNGQITAATVQASSFSALESLIQCGVKAITLSSDITLTSNLTIPSDVTLNLNYTSRTITIGAYTLTNEGTINVASGYTLTVTMTAGTGNLVNTGTITGEGNFTLMGTVTGNKPAVTGAISAGDFATLVSLISAGYDVITLGGTITLTSNYTVPSGVTLKVESTRTIAIGTYILTNEGIINVASGYTLTVSMTAGSGAFINNGTLTGAGNLTLTGAITMGATATVTIKGSTITANDEAALKSLISLNYKTIVLGSNITLTDDLDIPADVTLSLTSTRTVAVGTFTLTNKGTIEITGSYGLTVTMTAGSGAFVNTGTITGTGTLAVSGGTVTGGGTVTVETQMAASNEAELRALIAADCKTIIISGTITLTSDLEIPAGVTLSSVAAMTFYAQTYAFTNRGTIIENFGLTVSMSTTGAFVNYGTVTGTSTFNLTGAITLAGDGEITVTGTIMAGNFAALDTFMALGYKTITIGSTMTFTSDFVVPADVTLTMSGSRTFAIGTYTLTNYGRIMQTSTNSSYTLTITVTTGSFINHGTVSSSSQLALTGSITKAGNGTVTASGTVTANDFAAVASLISWGFKTITLGGNIVLTGDLVISADVTLTSTSARNIDVGGYTLTNNGTISGAITIRINNANGKFVNNGTVNTTGSITSNAAGATVVMGAAAVLTSTNVNYYPDGSGTPGAAEINTTYVWNGTIPGWQAI